MKNIIRFFQWNFNYFKTLIRNQIKVTERENRYVLLICSRIFFRGRNLKYSQRYSYSTSCLAFSQAENLNNSIFTKLWVNFYSKGASFISSNTLLFSRDIHKNSPFQMNYGVNYSGIKNPIFIISRN